MANTIKLKRSAVEGKAPLTTDLELGEVAINTTDGKVYIKKKVGETESIVEVTGGEPNVQVDWNETDAASDAYIKNKPTIPVDTNTTYSVAASVVTGGANIDLTDSNSAVDSVTFSGSGSVTVSQVDANTIQISGTDTNTTYSNATTSASGLMSSTDKSKLDNIADYAEVNVQANWNETNAASDAYILNKPTIPAAYSLPTATDTTLGGVKLGSATAQTTGANAVTNTSSRTYAIQNNSSGQLVVNVPWVDTNTIYSLPTATDTVLGGVKLASATQQTTGANAITTNANRTYGIQVNASGQLVVNVPWVDTNTTYSAATTSVSGLMSNTDKSKLDGIAAGAEVNVQADWNATTGDAFIQNKPTIPTVNNATLTVQGSNGLSGTGTFTANASANKTITLSHADTSTQDSVDNSDGTVIQDVTLDGNGHVTGLASTNLDGRYYTETEVNTKNASLRAHANITGGGVITFSTSGYLKNSARFIVISNGRGDYFGTTGYFDINIPLSGTITGVGGASNVTANSNGVPLDTWNALYYILPIGNNNTSVAANFRVVRYTSDFTVPDNWLLIAVRNGDTGQKCYVIGKYGLEAGESIDATVYDAKNADLLDGMNADTAKTGSTIVARSSSGEVTVNGVYFGSDPSLLYQAATDQAALRIGANGPSLEFKDAGSNTAQIGNLSGALSLSAGGSTPRATFDSSGRFFIGYNQSRTNFNNGTIAAPIIQVEDVLSPRITVVSDSTNGSIGGELFLCHQKSGATGDNTTIASQDSLGAISFQGSDGTEFYQAARIQGFSEGTVAANRVPGRIVFSTADNVVNSPLYERMIIKSFGSIYMGTTTGTISQSAFGCVINAGNFRTSRNIAGTGEVAYFGGTAGYARVMGDGDLENTNNRYTGLSDIKLKENIADANSQWDDIKAVRVRKYNFKEETGFSTHTQIGVIAQEIETVSPGLVKDNPDVEEVAIPQLQEDGSPVLDEEGNPVFEYKQQETGEFTKSVCYSVLHLKALKALQEAMERIEVLEQRLADAGIA